MKKMYTLLIASLLLAAGAVTSPASAHNHWRQNAAWNWRQNAALNSAALNSAALNSAAWNNSYNYNRAFIRQPKGGPWVNAQIAANQVYATRFSPAAQAAQNPFFNPYANPYYGSYGGYYGNGIFSRW